MAGLNRRLSGRTIRFIAVLLLFVVCKPVAAIPPPMSETDLDKNSDVIAKVRVLAVACTGYIEHDRTKEQLPVYEAWLQVAGVAKGNVKPNDTILVRWQDTSKKLIGPWKVEYRPGEEVKTHLKWDAENRVYATTWWNAKGKPSKEVEKIKLPVKAGQVVGLKAAD